MLLALFLVWLTGAIGMFILDGYFDFDLESMIKDDLYGMVLFACSIWWIVAPLATINWLRKSGINHRTEREKKAKEVEKLRVAVQKDIEGAMEEVEQEIIAPSKAPRRR